MSIPNFCSICRDEESTAPFAAVSGFQHDAPHYFHLDCIHPWIDQRVLGESKAPECPLCRRIFNQITLHDTDSNHTEIHVPLMTPYNLVIAIITHDTERLERSVRSSIHRPRDISPDNLATAVRVGIMYGNARAIRAILESGRVDREAFPSLLNRAAESGSRNAVELILQHGAPFSSRSRMVAASSAIRRGNYRLSFRLCPDLIRLPITFAVVACAVRSLQHFTSDLELPIPTAQELTMELTPETGALITLLLGVWAYHMLHNAQNVEL